MKACPVLSALVISNIDFSPRLSPPRIMTDERRGPFKRLQWDLCGYFLAFLKTWNRLSSEMSTYGAFGAIPPPIESAYVP